MSNLRVGVIGGGSWATAIVKILSENLFNVNWWMRDEAVLDHIKNFNNNPNYLSAVTFNPDQLRLFGNLHEIVKQSEILILAVPAAFIHGVVSELNAEELKTKLIFSAIKGIVPDYNLIMGEYLHQIFQIPFENIGVITGPCHAEEVALEKLSYLTIACPDSKNASTMADVLNCRYIKTIVSDDIYGTEYSSVLKNIFAVATGMTVGAGYGDNFRAVLISNAIQEIERFVEKAHPISRDINSSAYLGDLLVTCYSQFSRNRTFGVMIGKGYNVKTAQMEMNMIAEGYYAAKCIFEINQKLKVHLPISDMVYNVLYAKKSIQVELKKLSDQLS